MSELRDRIIGHSLILFEKHGFHGVSVHEIVQASGTSKGGFYHHFQSKDELLYVIHDMFLTYVWREARAADDTHPSPVAKVQAIIRAFVHVFDLYQPHISVYYQESIYLKAPYAEKINQKRDEFKQLIFHIVEEGQKTGHFRRELPLEVTAMAILGMVNWMYKWYRKDGPYTIEQIADVYTDLVLHLLLPRREDRTYFDHLLKVPFFYE
ncbi:TetR/AcrR family transcriptional regulator [Bacillus sp. SB49]|uniref:TetR/AcrR family transcriptional regulator n=1 Tax=Bacillus sp. SB49 TaxID=1071080 RepID=UPI0003F927CB|nr:TetR/AcrR family transcriptional regulator [Bacillus sp. SB49]QHT46771.1 TetR/AcrR family transcriptional regulator [Bacillus sp. SB49]